MYFYLGTKEQRGSGIDKFNPVIFFVNFEILELKKS